MKTLYLVEVSGQGSHWLTLVTKEVLDWICSRVTPGRQEDEPNWYDTATPAELHDGKQAHLFIGSYQNDRALFAIPNSGDLFFTSTLELVRWAQGNDVTIEDGFDGYIY